ncbi:YtxH domain-containing protein [Algoriphagus sp. C2-6-M1]|uniref:YtxH domain-containing protein n=1 Tax=Algoriphagus persicinus TaxID=3108754 RepID=UPI002B367FDD|nr:YtxH domain-containing protein [Algoriphagus sp. C2-6-M1]MEB2781443.1 YtxH domain-containing protein [Algoriphagus sp. C2-6-M1]
MSTSKVLLGVLVGAAAGTALGILLAPEKGSETRRKISKKGEDSFREIQVQFDQLKENIAAKYKSVIEDADSLIGKSKSKMYDGHNEFKNDDHHDSSLLKTDIQL